MRSSSFRTATVVAAAAFAAACSQTPVSPSGSSVALSGGGSGIAGFRAAGDSTSTAPEVTRVKICKEGNVAGTFTVTATPVNGGSASILTPITVQPGTCRVAAEDADDTGVGSNITVTETSEGLQSISAVQTTASGTGPFTYNNGDVLFLNSFHGYVITFTNHVDTPPPPPPTGDKGCTPGYWKNHTENWNAPYLPSSSFNVTFGIGTNWFSNSLTLLDAAGLGGGQEKALARHATAALLNSAEGISPLTTAQVIARVQAAYAGTADIEATKDFLEGYNTLGCPLN